MLSSKTLFLTTPLMLQATMETTLTATRQQVVRGSMSLKALRLSCSESHLKVNIDVHPEIHPEETLSTAEGQRGKDVNDARNCLQHHRP